LPRPPTAGRISPPIEKPAPAESVDAIRTKTVLGERRSGVAGR